MKRRLLNLLTALSVLLCVAVCVLWVRSRVRVDYWEWERTTASQGTDATREVTIQSDNGRLEISSVVRTHDWLAPQPPPADNGQLHFTHTAGPRGTYPQAAADESTQNLLGFSYGSEGKSYLHRDIFPFTYRAWWATFPIWLIAAPAALLPVGQFVRWCRVHRRPKRGHCPACGYDLRATPERCPECGHTPDGVTS